MDKNKVPEKGFTKTTGGNNYNRNACHKGKLNNEESNSSMTIPPSGRKEAAVVAESLATR